MKRIISLLLAALIMLAASGCGDNKNNEINVSAVTGNDREGAAEGANISEQPVISDITTKTYSLEELDIDFRQIRSIIETRHPMVYTDKEELGELFESQYKLIHDDMMEIDFYRVLSPVVAKLNCGHTSISISEGYEEYMKTVGNLLPLMVKVIDGKAYVYKDIFSSQIPEGSQIVRINNMDTEEIIRIFLDNITADGENLTKKYYIINKWFADMYFYHIGDPDSFNVAYIDKPTGDTLTAIIPAAAKEEIDERTYSINSANDKNYDKLYYGELEEDYAILRIKSLAFYDNDSSTVFKAFIDQFFGRMEKEHIPNLILDLRDNWGGDPYCTAHLFSYLIDKPVPYFAESAQYYIDLKLPLKPAENNYKGNVYTLINGASFSSAGHLSALLRFYDIATFLGEESGGSYLCTDSSKDIHLVNTGIRFHFATAPWEVAVSGLIPGRGIIPDYIVTPTIVDYLNNQDVVMEAAMDLITTE